jgi:RNA polymerase sigma-70 factor (ECF subfamily)
MAEVDEMRAAVDQAHQRWPELKLEGNDEALFAAHVRELATPEASLSAHGAELYLAFACKQGQPSALRVLERDYLARLGPAIARVDRSPAFVDEVRQIVFERLIVPPHSRIAQYAGTGPLEAWLRVIALRTALNLVQSARPREDVLADAMLEEVAIPSTIDKATCRAAVVVALKAAFERLSTRERNVFRLHYVDALNIDQIGALYGVHRATAARWLTSGRQEIFDNVKEDLQKQLKLTPSEVRSLVMGLKSQLDLSVMRLLEARHEAEAATR